MSELLWTSDSPTQEGLYWFKTAKSWIPAVVQLSNRRGVNGMGFYVDFIGSDNGEILEPGRTIPDSRWCGPLIPPEEPPA